MFFHSKSEIATVLREYKKLWRRRPTLLQTDQTIERKVNWLDLFFDLVFVIAIAQLSHIFYDEITLKLIGEFIILYIPLWWLRIGTIVYNQRFEDRTVRHRVMMFFLMIPILGMGYAMHGALDSLIVRYVISYMLGRVILNYLYRSAGKHTRNKQMKKIVRTLLLGFTGSLLLWAISLFVPLEIAKYIRLTAILLESITGFIAGKNQQDLPKFHYDHLKERFGLFMIIVLAEIIMGVFNGLADLDIITFGNTITAIGGFLIACLLFWIYFDQINYRPFKSIELVTFRRAYGHLPLTIGIALTGASLLHIVYTDSIILAPSEAWTVIGSLSLSLIAIGLLSQLHKATDMTKTLEFGEDGSFNKHLLQSKLLGVVILIFIGISTYFLPIPTWLFMIICISVLTVLAFEGLFHWINAKIELEEAEDTISY